jgi:catechol-2,3-dioxygenase
MMKETTASCSSKCKKASVHPEKRRHTGMQHVAFEYASLDNLLGTYIRLKGLGILPMWVADHGVAVAFYYEDPDQNVIELNVNNYGEAWTATEMLETAASGEPAQLDPEKMVAAREAGASPWEIHKRGAGGELTPAQPVIPGARL